MAATEALQVQVLPVQGPQHLALGARGSGLGSKPKARKVTRGLAGEKDVASRSKRHERPAMTAPLHP